MLGVPLPATRQSMRRHGRVIDPTDSQHVEDSSPELKPLTRKRMDDMPVRPRSIILFLLAMAMLAAALAWHLLGDNLGLGSEQNTSDLNAVSNKPDLDLTTLAPERLPEHNKADSPAATPTPMWQQPVADQPLNEIFAALDAEARRGNAAAACRLAMELDRCHQAWPTARNMLGAMEAMDRQNAANNVKLPDRARHRATMEAVFEQLESICAGSEALASTSKLRYLGIAADGGNVPSMVRYLEHDRLSAGAVMDDPSLLTHYRAHGQSYFLAALRAGDIDLLSHWRMALLSPHDSALFRVLPEEFRNVGLLNALEAQLSAEQRKGMFWGMREPGIGESPTAADTVRAAELYRAHFAHSPPGSSTMLGDYDAHLRDIAALDVRKCE